MCIIAAKAKGVPMPDEQTIENMWYANPDGAGFMYAEKGKVYVRKGYMKLKDFKDSLAEVAATHDMTKLPLVMHFRITTHGGTKPANCHPFPITDSIGVLSKPMCTCKVAVAHNGIIDIEPRKGISDTMEYIASQLAPLSRAVPEFYKNKHLIEMIHNATSRSRLAFLAGDGKIYTVGDFVKDDGMLYSNSSYLHTRSWRDFSYNSWHNAKSYDSDSCMLGNNGHYLYRNVMWLIDGYVTGTGQVEPLLDIGYSDEKLYAIDESNRLYEYSWEDDALEELEGASAWNHNGTRVRFDPDSPDVMTECIFVRDTQPVTTWEMYMEDDELASWKGELDEDTLPEDEM